MAAKQAGPPSKAAECAAIFGLSFVLAFGLRACVVEARYIPSHSMEPGLRVGDRLLVEKLSPRFGLPGRGEVLVFSPPLRAGLHNDLIKRVVALPGERVSIRDHHVWIDGHPLREPYVKEGPAYEEPDWDAIGMPGGVVPDRQLFMMGDNRNNSQDSHVFGPVPLRHVIGHAVLKFWPLGRLARL